MILCLKVSQIAPPPHLTEVISLLLLRHEPKNKTQARHLNVDMFNADIDKMPKVENFTHFICIWKWSNG